MPPRIPCNSCQTQQLFLASLETATSKSVVPSASLAIRSAAQCPSTTSCGNRRVFSTTLAKEARTKPTDKLLLKGKQPTLQKRLFLEWIEKFERFREPSEMNYLSRVIKNWEGQPVAPNQPFPCNPDFRSEPVLSEAAREKIWHAVIKNGMPLKAVSAQYGVDMRRVAAVVRMKEIEKQWEREGKPLAIPYAKAMMKMLPKAELNPGDPPFEPINDIHVHSYTMQQLFVPVSESRHFTREDAAKAFGDHILPPDAKMRIPELVSMEKRIAEGMDARDAQALFIQEAAESERKLAEREQARLRAEEARRIRVQTNRFEFRFEQINAEEVGPTGRARNAVGWRYGVPFYDRRRGEVKIPTKVE